MMKILDVKIYETDIKQFLEGNLWHSTHMRKQKTGKTNMLNIQMKAWGKGKKEQKNKCKVGNH